jgi:NAD(P)-dependent dehydrogenase (short-subunit alcohol dehydrogenase family)
VWPLTYVRALSPGAVDTNMSGNSRKLEPGFPIKAEFEQEDGVEEATDDADAATHAESAENAAVDEVKLPDPFDPTPRLFEWSVPADVAYAILFLASDEAAGITGVNLPVDNGFSIRGLE